MKKIKSFNLGGHKIKVKYFKTVRCPETGAEIFGLCNPMTNEIWVAEQLKGNILAEDVIAQTLCHERVHYMLVLLNLAELNQDEAFVDMMGMFLHQYDKTKK
jgi:hypothetical protein